MLTRVVRKSMTSSEVVVPGGEKTIVQVDCLMPELTPRFLVAILCNDLLVLCKDPSGGKEHHSIVDLWAVLRMQTLPQPASVVHGNGKPCPADRIKKSSANNPPQCSVLLIIRLYCTSTLRRRRKL